MTYHAHGARRACAAGTALMLFAGGCLASEQEGAVPVEAIDAFGSPVIGGFPADSPTLDAIGSISISSEDAETAAQTFDQRCTGALIGPRTVLTAKHCLSLAATAATYEDRLVFTVGPDAEAPSAFATVIDTAGAPGASGGFMNTGRDVGVMQLDTPLAPAAVQLGSVSDADVGQRFIGIGYGTQSNAREDSTRRLGTLTLRARAGRTYELLYGSFETFYRQQTGSGLPQGCPAPGEVPSSPAAAHDACAFADQMRRTYEDTRLEQVEEIAVGMGPGDAQPCYGDSGGPLLRAGPGGELIAYGVASGGVPSDDLLCDHGGIYASLGTEVTAFLQEAIAWEDPCAALPAAGVCVGERAQRCSTAAEGHRRVIEVDCALLGLRCIAADTGAACEAAGP